MWEEQRMHNTESGSTSHHEHDEQRDIKQARAQMQTVESLLSHLDFHHKVGIVPNQIVVTLSIIIFFFPRG